MTYSPDGKFLAAGDWDGWLRWWDIAKEKTIWETKVPQYELRLMAVSPDGKTLATAGSDALIRLWDTRPGKEKPASTIPLSSTHDLAMHPSGQSVVAADHDGKLRQWDLNTGKIQRAIANDQRFASVAFEPGTANLVTIFNQQLHRWNFDDNRFIPLALAKNIEPPIGFAFSGNGKVLVTLTKDKVFLWDWPTMKLRHTWSLLDPKQPEPECDLWSFALSPEGDRLLTYVSLEVRGSARAHGLELWDMQGKKLHEYIKRSDQGLFSYNRFLAILPGQQGVLLSPLNHSFFPNDKELESLRIIGPIHDKKIRKFIAPKNRRNQGERVSDHAAFSPDGRTIASGERDHNITIYETASGLPRRVLEGHRGPHSHVAFTPDGKRLVSFNSDLTGLVWDLRLASTLAQPPTMAQWQTAWSELLSTTDGLKVHDAMARLAALPTQTIDLLQKQLTPAKIIDPKRLEQLFAELDSAKFPVRDQAYLELDKLGEDVLLPMRAHLKKNPPLEVARRLERLIDKHDPDNPPPARLRELRAIEILEQLGTLEARKLLETLAAGPPTARRTQDAAAALGRLDRVAKSNP